MLPSGSELTIWVDADACPKPVKLIILRASERTGIQVVFVANQALFLPQLDTVKSMIVPKGFDEADAYIVNNCQSGDLVITADIPLAAEVVKKRALALNPRGKCYSSDNVQEILSMRDAMTSLRDTGLLRGGPNRFTDKDRQLFANALDKWLSKRG